jgi:hypothetical protein
MTRVMLLAVVSVAMLVIAPLMGASNSLSLASDSLQPNVSNSKGIFDDIFGGGNENDDEDDREAEENDREAEDDDRNSDEEFRRRDDFGRDRDNNDDWFEDFGSSREERQERIQRRGGGHNPYGEGDPRGGGQYEWR